jgi:hypothetical protein
MCLAPKAPQMPPAPAAPAPTPLPEPPPPAPVTTGGAAATIARPSSQRAAKRQASRGPSALSIPMGGSSAPSPTASQGGAGGNVKLNIGK